MKPARTTRRDAYLAMLAKGGSEYPIDELKTAGVDMTTSAPFQAAIKEMNSVMDEMERLLKQKPERKRSRRAARCPPAPRRRIVGIHGRAPLPEGRRFVGGDLRIRPGIPRGARDRTGGRLRRWT